MDSSYFDDNQNTQQQFSDVDLNNPPATFAIPPIESNAASSYVVKTRIRKTRATTNAGLSSLTVASERQRHTESSSGPKSKQVISGTMTKTMQVASVERKPLRYSKGDEEKWFFRFHQLVEYKQQHGDCSVPKRFVENPQLGKWVITQRKLFQCEPKTISDERIQRLDDLGFDWDPHQAQWKLRFKELLEYKQKHGDCLVPHSFQDNPQLGTWVSNQRSSYHRLPKTISDERIQRLNDVGFEWAPHRAKWESRFKELVKYNKQHGDCMVPNDFQDNPQLGIWVIKQRIAYNGVPKTISDERIQRLNDIGFEWDPLQAQWESRFRELLEYKRQHGDCLVPNQYADNPQLGEWVCTQRKLYKCEPRTISDVRIQRLNDIGFEWDPLRVQWELRFKELLEYKHKHGDCLVPFSFQDNPQLGMWVARQRSSHNLLPKTISDERIQRLENIGFEWDPLQAQWESRFKELLEYKRQHGDCLVPQSFQDNAQLGNWVSEQRSSYHALPKTISDERIQRLNDIGFEWDPLRAQWESRFKELLEYKRQHGDCLVPTQFRDNPQLGQWVSNQRSSFHGLPTTISDERIQRLNDIGFEWDPLQAQWESRFKELLEYKRQHGDCLVPTRFQDNPQLGLWVTKQRNNYNCVPKTISREQFQRLAAIGFEWDAFKVQWESRFRELVEYKQQHGNCLVPRNFEETPGLGNWVSNQRKRYKQVPKQISDEYVQRLNDIGFAWVGRAMQGEEGFEENFKFC